MGLGGSLGVGTRGPLPPAMTTPCSISLPIRTWSFGLVVLASGALLAAQTPALPGGTVPFRNTAYGDKALASIDLSGDFLSRAPESAMNVAVGYAALMANTTGYRNVAVGAFALGANVSGHGNVALGRSALGSSVAGADNTAIGDQALFSLQSGSGNIALGSGVGAWLTSGSDNLYVGATTAFPGGRQVSESGTIRIGDVEGRHRALYLGGVQDAGVASVLPLAMQRDGKVVRLQSLPELPGGTPVVVDDAGHLGRGVAPGRTLPSVVAEPLSGSILLLRSGSQPPAGFTRLGVMRSEYRPAGSAPKEITLDLYVKP